MKRFLRLSLLVALIPLGLSAQQSVDSAQLHRSVQELRESVGSWTVTTEFMNPDGTVAASEPGSYSFEWVVPDRVVVGKTSIPNLDSAAGILFYINQGSNTIEMVSVGNDGKLWIMKGPLGGDSRMTDPYSTGDGGTNQLRFTRYNAGANRFESRMEYSTDDGKTWVLGNHQVFVRDSSSS